MTEFDELIEKLNKKKWLLGTLHQNDFKDWVVALRPAYDVECARGQGSTKEIALKKAIKDIKNRMTERSWKKLAKTQDEKRKKERFKGRRVRL